MIKVQEVPRLQRLREGFDRCIERLYAEKAREGYPVVVAGADGEPVVYLTAAEALARFRQRRE